MSGYLALEILTFTKSIERLLRPNSRRTHLADLSPEARTALTWFDSEVPERTLHNWQNAAAKLLTQHMRETL